jgi:predicted Zn-dependent peptidase
VIEDPLAPTPAFAVGYRVPDPVARLDDLLAFVVLASVLADGDASRLRSRLVHRDATVTDLACYIGTFGDALAMRDPVLLQLLVFHPGLVDTDALLAVVDEELARVANEGPSPDELSRVAATYAASHWREQDQLLGRAQSFAIMELIHGSADLAGDLPGLVAAVSKEAVARAAASLLGQNRVVLEVKPTRSGSGGGSGAGRRRAGRRT